MNIRIVAAAAIGSYIAADGDGSYVVLTLDDTRDVELGDVLSGTFDGHGSLSYSVRNVTKREDVRICLESWGCSVESAIGHILDFMRSRPGVIFAGAKRFVSDADNIAGDLRAEILRS